MRDFLDDFQAAEGWLRQVGFEEPQAAHRNFVQLAERGVPLDLLDAIRADLARCLPGSADPDRAFNNFERVFENVRSPLSLATFLVRKPLSLAILMQMFSASQYFSELIIANPEFFDYLWEHGQAVLDPKLLRDEVLAEMRSIPDGEDHVMNLIRRIKQRELLRIGYRDIVLGEPLDRVTESISDLADCLVDVALTIAYRTQSQRHGEPRSPAGDLSRLVVLAMGKLGGRELNYSSDIDLIVIYDKDGATDGRRSITNDEFFTRVIRDLIKLLTHQTSKGAAYRVDFRLRPHGHQAPLCLSLAQTLAYYDQHGRTWERQALVKIRPIAGSYRLGDEFLQAIEPFVYRRYLSHVEINEIKAIKRRIESKTRDAGADATDLKTGHGGIRDTEFVTQFLQLLNGGRLHEVRERNTLRALKKLVGAGCINPDEHSAMETAYRFLRKAEHRLQFMFDLQTHRIPEDPRELDRLALRLGNRSAEGIAPGQQFVADLRRIAGANRNVLNRLMLELFPSTDDAGKDIGEIETDLLLDPDPDDATVRGALARYQFTNVQQAYENITRLAQEEVPFLSSVRCRHFLASILPRLLAAVADAPDPDMALTNLEQVTRSLGAKGVLWESFSVNPPLLSLYVNVCSWSQFLSEILINNPGMIDELLDSLVMDQPPRVDELKNEIDGLLRGARDPDPILHGFKNTHLLGIGARDILGKNTPRETTRQLSELAQAVVAGVTNWHWNRLVAEHGTPMLTSGQHTAWFVILGLGKFGGNELNYHSDLDLVLVYEEDGTTQGKKGQTPKRGTTSNHHFYSELAQRIVVSASRLTPYGRLYSVDLRLRPTGRSGSLVLPLDKFAAYYHDSCALWERQALTRARVVFGDAEFGDRVALAVRHAICGRPWLAAQVDEIADMRKRLEASRGKNDIKRGVGGLADVDFIVQLAQIRHGRRLPRILQQNVWDCLEEIRATEIWNAPAIDQLLDSYTFLRTLESRIRIVHNVARDDLPDDPADLAKLAYRMGYDGADAGRLLRDDLARHTQTIRRLYNEYLDRERAAT